MGISVFPVLSAPCKAVVRGWQGQPWRAGGSIDACVRVLCPWQEGWHSHSPDTILALAVSPATGSPSFPHSGFAQRCHILPQSKSPYPLSQEELPWAVPPLLPRAQHGVRKASV